MIRSLPALNFEACSSSAVLEIVRVLACMEKGEKNIQQTIARLIKTLKDRLII
jgi:hypothetical protein